MGKSHCCYVINFWFSISLWYYKIFTWSFFCEETVMRRVYFKKTWRHIDVWDWAGGVGEGRGIFFMITILNKFVAGIIIEHQRGKWMVSIFKKPFAFPRKLNHFSRALCIASEENRLKNLCLCIGFFWLARSRGVQLFHGCHSYF